MILKYIIYIDDVIFIITDSINYNCYINSICDIKKKFIKKRKIKIH